MTIKVVKELREAESLPFGYGVAHFDVVRRVTVVAPIPLNWLLRWARLAYWRLVWPKTMSYPVSSDPSREAFWNDGYRAGKAVGYHKGYSDGAVGAKFGLSKDG